MIGLPGTRLRGSLMRIYDVSTAHRKRHQQHVNWSRELTFSTRQSRFISQSIPCTRGVYGVYAKDYLFSYETVTGRKHWSSVVYIGSGYISERLSRHLRYAKNDVLAGFVDKYDLAYRYAVINDHDDLIDYPRAVEATLIGLFVQRFGMLPPANRREEFVPTMDCDEFILAPSANFDILSYGC